MQRLLRLLPRLLRGRLHIRLLPGQLSSANQLNMFRVATAIRNMLRFEFRQQPRSAALLFNVPACQSSLPISLFPVSGTSMKRNPLTIIKEI